jgi:dGTPase
VEVAQIARSLAHALGLDQDLAETIALAHDLGHPPFGHAGEDELQVQMEPFGGFDHNVQTFRVVTKLERRYPGFDGLNLSWETVEGVVKHNGPVTHKLDDPAWQAIADYTRTSDNPGWDLRLNGFASLEAQAAAIADDIAYNNHDVDDGVQAGLFTLADLAEVPLIGPVLKRRARRLARSRRADDPAGGRAADDRGHGRRRAGRDRSGGWRRTGSVTPEDVRTAKRTLIQFSPPCWPISACCAPSCSSGCIATTASTAPAARRGESWPRCSSCSWPSPRSCRRNGRAGGFGRPAPAGRGRCATISPA